MQRGLRKVGRRDSCLPDHDLDPAWATDRFRFDAQLAALRATPEENEQASSGARVFYRESHQLLDKPGKDNLARKRLRSLDDGFDIQQPSGLADRRHGSRRSFCFTLPSAPQRS